ncbi:acyl carrier protein [Nocardia sp. NBC_00881]|uniref:acyl carrier protein n=1 Tax=Nocardia sp. NBC_00881 TaxID=2975995 RepID=UPI003865DA13|nr:acyl carrier protein [Nocardia sp. NBC_00881]
MTDKTADITVAGRLTSLVAEQLEIAPESLDRGRSLGEYGITSVIVAGLAGDIEEEFGIAVDLDVIRDHPTINAMSQLLCDQGAM